MGGLLILSIFSWRHTYCFGKCFAEIGRIAKTQQLGNLYDSQLWPVIQQILCPLDFQSVIIKIEKKVTRAEVC